MGYGLANSEADSLAGSGGGSAGLFGAATRRLAWREAEAPYGTELPGDAGPGVAERDASAAAPDLASSDPSSDRSPEIADPDAEAEASDPDALEELADEIVTLAAHLHAGTHRFLVLIGRFDRLRGWERAGHQSCARWLSYRTGLDLGTAREPAGRGGLGAGASPEPRALGLPR